MWISSLAQTIAIASVFSSVIGCTTEEPGNLDASPKCVDALPTAEALEKVEPTASADSQADDSSHKRDGSTRQAIAKDGNDHSEITEQITPKDLTVDKKSALDTVQPLLVRGRYELEWKVVDLKPGAADPQCLVPEKINQIKMEVLRRSEIATVLQETRFKLNIEMSSLGYADGLRIRESGPLCQTLKGRFERESHGIFYDRMPRNCNEFLAAVRAISCLQQVESEIDSALQYAHYSSPVATPYTIQAHVNFETCAEPDAKRRGAKATIVLEFYVSSPDQVEAIERSILSSGGTIIRGRQ